MDQLPTAQPVRLMSYQEASPSLSISHLAQSFWEFSISIEAPGTLAHEVFPDGCTSLVYFRNTGYKNSWVHLVGPRLDSLHTVVHPGDIFWGVRLAPAVSRLVLGCDPLDYRNRTAQFEMTHASAYDITSQLNQAGSFPDAVASFSNYLSSLSIGPGDIDPAVSSAVGIIEKHKGQLRIAELAESLELSMRQLQRRFLRSVGLSPKQFARLRRLRATVVDLIEDENRNWASRAAELGYADQPHLTRDFGSATGQSPGTFADRISGIDHGPLVK